MRRFIVLTVLGVIAVSAGSSHSLEKFDRDKRLGITGQVPAVLGEWRDITPPSSQPASSSAYNELYRALYEHPRLGRIALTIEYTSDSRRQFELHYPEVCHKVRGDLVIPYPAWNLVLAEGTSLRAAVMSWQQRDDGYAALSAYWYVTGDGITTDTVRLKRDQALSGLLRRPAEAAMVRFDSFYQSDSPALERGVRMQAIQDLAERLSEALRPAISTKLFRKLDGVTT
jgi:EpsI family protein